MIKQVLVIYTIFVHYIHTKFDNNGSGSLEDYLWNKNQHRRGQKTNCGQTDGNETFMFSYSRGYETLRKHKSGQSSALYYNTCLAYPRKVNIVF